MIIANRHLVIHLVICLRKMSSLEKMSNLGMDNKVKDNQHVDRVKFASY